MCEPIVVVTDDDSCESESLSDLVFKPQQLYPFDPAYLTQ